MEQKVARPKYGRPLQNLLPPTRDGLVAAARILGGHFHARTDRSPSAKLERVRESRKGTSNLPRNCGSLKTELCIRHLKFKDLNFELAIGECHG
jgi:hypothetical protein